MFSMIPVLGNLAFDKGLLKNKENFVAFFIYYSYNFGDALTSRKL